jgi:uncharacterized membrane protein YbhN (UPF0104 family)
LKPPASIRHRIAWIASIAISVGLFWYLLSQIDVGELGRTVTRMSPAPLATFVVLHMGGVLARAARFWVLLRRTVPIPLLLGITLARNLFVDLLPARTGELSYVYLLARTARRTPEEGLATLLMALFLDVIALGPLLVFALVIVGGEGQLGVRWMLAAAVLLGAGAYAALRSSDRVAGGLAGLLARSASSRLQSLASRVRLLAESLERSRAEGALRPAFLLSLVVRVCKFGSFYCLVLAVLAPSGYSIEQLGILRVFLGVVGAELAATLPIHGVAGFGTYEAAWAFSFVQLGFPRQDAIVSGIVAHAASQVLEYSLGAAALIWLMRPSRQSKDPITPSWAMGPTSDREP